MRDGVRLSKTFFQTIRFFFDAQKIKFLFSVPAALLLLLGVYEHFCPFLMYADTPDLQLHFSPRTAPVYILAVLFLITGVTCRSMGLVLFGQGEKALYVPRVDRTYGRFLLALAVSAVFSALLSSALCALLMALIEQGVKAPPFPPQVKVMITVAFIPYLMIRTGFCLTGAVAGEKISLFLSWRETGRLGFGYAVFYFTLFVAPIMAGLFLIRLYPENRMFVGFVLCLSLIVSGAFQGVFLAKLFAEAGKAEE